MSEDHPTVKVARDLREIVTLHAELRHQAEADGDDPGIPGGTAMVALGPVANIEEWENRQQATERYERGVEGYRRAYTSVAHEDPDESWSAFQLIEFWSEAWRGERGEEFEPGPHRPRPSIATEVSYVRHMLDWAWENEAHWAEFAADVKAARLRLEDILSRGNRAERTRVTCASPTCEGLVIAEDGTEKRPRLIKVYAPRYLAAWRCGTCATETPGLLRCAECSRTWTPRSGYCTNMVASEADRKVRVQCRGRLVPLDGPPTCFDLRCPSFAEPAPVWASDPADDWWKCPGCKLRYDAEDFRKALARMLWRPEAERWVAAPDAVDTLVRQGRGKRTVRRWLAPPDEYVDRCEECDTVWPEAEHAACPRVIHDHDCDPKRCEWGEPCGGILARELVDPDAVIEGYCEVSTRKTWLWWPSLWRLHLTTRTTPRARIGA